MIIEFYPGRLSNAEIGTLRSMCIKCITGTSEKLGDWLREILLTEQRRRLSENSDDIREVELPDLPVASWTSPEIGDALQAIFIAETVTRGGGELAEFLLQVSKVITVASAKRLREIPVNS
jgi:hypothetical protein